MSRKRSAKRKSRERIEFEAITQNVVAMTQGPSKRKSWSVLDIKNVKALNAKQESMISSYIFGNHVIADGSAGTGKTFIALWLGLNSIFSKEEQQNHIIIVRSAVPSRDIGFLPGSAEEKLEPYEQPYKDHLYDLVGKSSTYDDMKEAGKIKFMPTSFVRGSTWDNAVVIIDEAQNMTLSELNSVLTRIGTGSRLIVCGDYAQSDLVVKKTDVSGFKDFLAITKNMKSMDTVSFTRDDIVRSAFVKEWIIAKEELGL